jgi:hypothetical protein
MLQRTSGAPNPTSTRSLPEGGRDLGLRLSRTQGLDELREHLSAATRQRASAEALRWRRQAAQPEHVSECRAFRRRTSRATVAMMYVGFKRIDPSADVGFDPSKEYEQAVAMHQARR